MRSFSISFLTAWICEVSSRASLVVTEAAMTGRETPQARPRAVLEGTGCQRCSGELRMRQEQLTEDVGDVLVLAEEGEVENDLNGLDVGGHDDELGDTTVQAVLCQGACRVRARSGKSQDAG
jgi:hypothetical protein